MRADAERNREQLLDAAVELILEVGGEPRRDAIATRAGVGIATLYRHFPDRQSLLHAVAWQVLNRSIATGEAALADSGDSVDALRRYMHEAVDGGLGALNLVCPLLEHPQWPEQRTRAEGLLLSMLERAKSEGRIRDSTSATEVGFAIIRFCRPLAVGRPLTDERAIAHRHINTYIDGLTNRRE